MVSRVDMIVVGGCGGWVEPVGSNIGITTKGGVITIIRLSRHEYLVEDSA